MTSDTDLPADLSNWRQRPHSAWAFQHVDRLMPVHRIAAAAAPGAPWPHAAPGALDGFQLKAGGKVLGLAQFLDATSTDALLVVADGRIVHEAFAHGNSAATPHILMSATKSVVGLLAGVLQAAGDLDLASPVSALVPEVAASPWRGATVRQLLDMRGGVVLDPAQAAAYATATGWEPATTGSTGLHGFFEAQRAPDAPHGGAFRYQSANTDLLGWALERATGRRFAELLAQRLWQPLGAEHDAFITVDRDGTARCTGGLCARVRDFARLGQLVLDGGRDVVPAAWLDDIAGGGDAQAWAQSDFAAAFGGRAMRYRSGWYVVDDEPKLLFAMGIHGQHLFVDRANGLVVAKFSSQELPVDPRATGLTLAAVAEIRRCLGL
jgi:CubicO group peptidase (beta-lactamase class C family)